MRVARRSRRVAARRERCRVARASSARMPRGLPSTDPGRRLALARRSLRRAFARKPERSPARLSEAQDIALASCRGEVLADARLRYADTACDLGVRHAVEPAVQV